MNNDYLDEVAIVGVGCTRFGEQFDKSYADLAVDAAYEAIADAGIEPKDIQAAWLGTQLPTDGLEGNCGIWLADYLGIFDIPVGRCTAACASGMEAFVIFTRPLAFGDIIAMELHGEHLNSTMVQSISILSLVDNLHQPSYSAGFLPVTI